MTKKSLSFLLLGLGIGIVLTAVVFSLIIGSGQARGGTGKVMLKLAHVLPASAPVHKGMVRMSELAAEKSGGLVDIQVFPNGQLGSETDTIEQLQRGALAMVKSSTAPLESFIPEMAVFSVPYLFRDADHYWKVLEGEIGKSILSNGGDTGIRGLCYYDSGARSFYTIQKPVLTPDDLNGMKIRVMKSKTSMDMVDVLGGSPTPIPFGELYTALQQGMVDGAENNPPSMYDTRHWEVAKHYSINEHARIPDIVLFSQKIWDSLSPQVKGWVQEAADESVTYQRQIWNQYVGECLENLEAEGVTMYHPDKFGFQVLAKQMYGNFDGTSIESLIEQIQAIE
ncbi:MAG: TRAP transporter substrate-binding protein DctP [Opitutaceae bacterium]|nr:TRAP transporter substrate-binding protein DctP [Opitutaceae bacterium]|tara:strand:+ start:1347 stop:2363 length:1017 start_codon:yes stop_codon:yes gene_type:complete